MTSSTGDTSTWWTMVRDGYWQSIPDTIEANATLHIITTPDGTVWTRLVPAQELYKPHTPQEQETMNKLTDAQLLQMAQTAFDVLNWARREGFKKRGQLEQVVDGFKLDLGDFQKQASKTEDKRAYNRDNV